MRFNLSFSSPNHRTTTTASDAYRLSAIGYRLRAPCCRPSVPLRVLVVSPFSRVVFYLPAPILLPGIMSLGLVIVVT